MILTRSARQAGGRAVVELLGLLGSLGAVALILLVATAVVRQARRRPLTVSALIGVAVGVGAGAIGYAAAEGFGYRPDSRSVEFASDAGRQCFDAGFVLLTLGCPAWLLVIVGRIRNGEIVGPRGAQWAVVLFGYWMACAIWGGALYMWLTGYTK
jgi:hypothetical protein